MFRRSPGYTRTDTLFPYTTRCRSRAGDYQERGQDVAVAEVADVADVAVRARPMLLKRALRNLADNAVAYGVRARLSVRVEGGAARIAISDDGPGPRGRASCRERVCPYV